jgi:hypothetical protein
MSKTRQRETSAKALATLDKKQGIKRHYNQGRIGTAYRQAYYGSYYYENYNAHYRSL